MFGSFVWSRYGLSDGWVSNLAAGTTISVSTSVNIVGSTLFVVGDTNLNGTSSGNIQVASFALGNGSINWQETVNRVAAQYSTFSCIDSNGLIRIAGTEYIGSTPTIISIALNQNGTLNSATRVTVAGSLTTNGITADTSGNVYIICNDTSVGYIYKFDATNTFVLAKGWSGAFLGYGIVSQGSNLIFNGDIGGSKAFTASITNDLFTVNWARQLSTFMPIPSGNQIQIDGSGNSYQLSTPGAVYVLKYNSGGVLQWQRQLTGTGSPTSGACIVVPGGLIISYYSTSNYGIVAYYNSAGIIQWQSKFTNSAGAVIITHGSTDGTYVYLSGSVNTQNFFVMKLPIATAIPNGTYGTWTIAAGGQTESAGGQVDSVLAFALSARSTTTTSATPTITPTSLTFSNTLL